MSQWVLAIAGLIATGEAGQLPFHAKRGMDNGLTRTELSEVATHLARDRAQGLGRRAEQDAVDDLLVLVGDGGDFLRHGEDDVEVLGAEDLAAAVLQPLGAGQRLALWAVPVPAAVVRDALMPALIALVDMAARRRRAAALDRGHDAALRRRQGRVVPLTIGVAVAAEHIRHFRPRPGHGRALRSARARRASA